MGLLNPLSKADTAVIAFFNVVTISLEFGASI
jgi:hypothetical protein